MHLEKLRDGAAQLLRSAGIAGAFEISALPGGANNRVFLLRIEESSFVLKAYFHDRDDRRDRLGTEFAFLRFAWHEGIRSIPKPLACDAENRLALLEYLPGKPICKGAVDKSMLEKALRFFRALNRSRGSTGAGRLPIASEACFSIEQHTHCVDNRIRRLETIVARAGVDAEAAAFVADELTPAWTVTLNSIRRKSAKLRLSVADGLARAAWCLSPSDFGFHNAIQDADGKLRFLDFEYAGWDDPARMLCDFFCQPAVAVPVEYFEWFAKEALADLPLPHEMLQRAHLLLPAYRIKWCCILLNDFLEPGHRRRHFACESADPEARKVRQLARARSAFADLRLTTNPCSAPAL